MMSFITQLVQFSSKIGIGVVLFNVGFALEPFPSFPIDASIIVHSLHFAWR